MELNLSKEKKDDYRISADPWGVYKMESVNLIYGQLCSHHGLQCRNANNHDKIIQKCAEVVKLIEEIEQLNK